MEKIYSNALKIEREVAGIEKLGGERKKIIVHGTKKIKCFLKFQRDYINLYIWKRWKISWLSLRLRNNVVFKIPRHIQRGR